MLQFKILDSEFNATQINHTHRISEGRSLLIYVDESAKSKLGELLQATQEFTIGDTITVIDNNNTYEYTNLMINKVTFETVDASRIVEGNEKNHTSICTISLTEEA